MSSKGNPKIPQLVKKEYYFWKARMRMYLRFQDTEYLRIIDEGPFTPEKLVPATVVEGVEIEEHFVLKLPREFTKEEKEQVEKDGKVINILVSGIDNEMLNTVMSCGTAKEMWDTIQTMCEGGEDVKENRIQLLTHDYESFDCRSGESLSDLYGRFKRLINDLILVGRIYTNQDICFKFMRALPRKWDSKITAIEEARDLKLMTLEELYSKLQTYELRVNQQSEKHGAIKVKSVALSAKGKEKLQESFAVKQRDEVPEYEASEEDEEEDEFGLEEIPEEEMDRIKEEATVLVARRMANFRGKRFGKRPATWSRNAGKQISQSNLNITCYNCKEPGHYASTCNKPKVFSGTANQSTAEQNSLKAELEDLRRKYNNLLKSKGSGRAYIAEGRDWAEDDEQKDNHYTNLGLMATSSDKVQFLANYNKCNPHASKSQTQLAKELKSAYNILDNMSKENERLKQENDMLVARNTFLEEELQKFAETKTELEKTACLLKCSREVEKGTAEKLKIEVGIKRKWTENAKKMQIHFDSQVIRQTKCLSFVKESKRQRLADFYEGSDLKKIHFVKSHASLNINENPWVDQDSFDHDCNVVFSDTEISSQEISMDCSSPRSLIIEKDVERDFKLNPSDLNRKRNGKTEKDKSISDSDRKACWHCGEQDHLSFNCISKNSCSDTLSICDSSSVDERDALTTSDAPLTSTDYVACLNEDKKSLTSINSKKKYKLILNRNLSTDAIINKLTEMNVSNRFAEERIPISRTALKAKGPNISWVPKAI
jgi:gag-polypeptide of LTR copia-type/Zinc knuckle